MRHIGHGIKRIRIVKKLNQKQLAEKSNSTQSTIARVESGLRNPSLSLLEQISIALGVNLCVLFLYAEEEDPDVSPFIPLVNKIFLEAE